MSDSKDDPLRGKFVPPLPPGEQMELFSGAATQDAIRGLQPIWSNPFSHMEFCELASAMKEFKNYPFDTVREWLQSKPEYPPLNRLTFIRNHGQTVRARAEKWKEEQTPEVPRGTWLPENWREIASEITGEDCSGMEHWTEIPVKFQFKFEKACRGME